MGVYRSTDAGATWLSITGSPYVFGYADQFPQGIAVDDLGNVYVAGYANETVQTRKGTTTYRHWLVLKGARDIASDSQTWSKVHDIGGAASASSAYASGVLCSGSEVFVVGTDASGWRVNKSTNGGAGWSTIDQASGGSANALAADPTGNLLVTGHLPRKGGSGWAVRKGTRNGGFSTVALGENGNATGVTVDPAGDVHVIGNSTLSTATNHWVARRGKVVNGVWSWVQTDGGQGVGTHAPAVRGVASDSAGNVYAVGITEQTDNSALMLRHLAPTP